MNQEFKKIIIKDIMQCARPDLFENTEHADTRPEAIKEFNKLQQEREEQRKNNKMDISGLPLFSEEERISRATVQEKLF